jgi:NTE family protein
VDPPCLVRRGPMPDLVTRAKPLEPTAPKKLGLALSGGGFRTALFHIGTLLRLAELGVLKHVGVLSTVSGGSIVGAAFYLRLLKRVEEVGGPLTDKDLIWVVEELAATFPEGVAKNVRVRTFTSYPRNVEMSQADYSRSDRVAELYDRYFFDGILGPGRVTMKDLGTRLQRVPVGSPADGAMPELFINATSLTTGRCWRFSAATMGEAPLAGQAADIDRVTRFVRPGRYEDLDSPRPADVPLSIAVAASSALPGGLHPMSISEMYEGLRIQLVDGGVHDNQGVQSLVLADCTEFVVSDTGGQMTSEEQARTSFLSVLLRAPQILYGRVRQEQLMRASERRVRGEPSPLALIHLRRGTSVDLVTPRGLAGPGTREPDPVGESSTAFGVAPDVMDLLADLRTDLDSFSEVETKSLMSAGYLVTGPVMGDANWSGKAYISGEAAPEDGSALGLHDVAPYLLHPSAEFLRQLKIGGQRFFKVFRLYPAAGKILLGLILALAGWGGWTLFRHWNSDVPLGWLIVGLLAIAAVIWVPTTTWGARLLDTPAATAVRWIRNVLVVGPLTWIWSNAHLVVMEGLFRKAGTVQRVWIKGPPTD